MPNCITFLVTESDRKHEIAARDFNIIEARAFIACFPETNMPKENHSIKTESLGKYGTLYATVKNQVVLFKRGRFFT